MPRATHRRSVVSLVAAASVAVCGLLVPRDARAADWPVIPQAELALKEPKLQSGADAEALLWDVRVTDSQGGDDVSSVLQHYVRIKIFSDRGRETYGKVELPYTSTNRVREIEGRTIAPSGTVVELKSQDVFDRTVIEASGLKLRVKSFVLPAVTPGSIIEYRWKEVRDSRVANYLELPLQRDIATHVVRYHIRPLSVRDLGYQMRIEWFNMTTPPETVNEENGYSAYIVRNVPALRTEPLMPPELAVKPWILIYYADLGETRKTAEKFWLDYGKNAYGTIKPQLRATPEIKSALAGAAKSGGEARPSLASLVALARSKVKRDDTDTALPGAGDHKANRSPTDTLKRGIGDGYDLTMLVAALATAAGHDAHVAMLPDRSKFLSSPQMRQPHFIETLAVAVRSQDGTWSFADPANEHSPGGHLAWAQEGQYALVLDDKTPEFVPVPVSGYDYSTRTRTVALTLREDGTVEGDVTLQYAGHAAAQLKERDDDDTPETRQETFTADFARRMPGAVFSAFSAAGLDEAEMPYVVKFHVVVPGYAQRTGSRLFVQPAFAQHGAEALFSAGTRTQRVLFPFGYLEQDTVTLALPAGYDVEADAGPPPASLSTGAGMYTGKVAVDATARRVTLTRTLLMGAQGLILYEPTDYTGLKAFFDAVQRGDGYAIALRRTAPAAP